jgi:hypothetical protein
VLGFLVRALGLSGEAEQRRAWNTSTHRGVLCDIPEPVMAKAKFVCDCMQGGIVPVYCTGIEASGSCN